MLPELGTPVVRLGYLIAVVVAVVDQAIKRWIEAALEYGQAVVVAPSFNIVHARNRGVSFGILNSDDPWVPWLLGGVAIAILIALAVWLHRGATRLVSIGLGLVMGGAVGNVVDRAVNFDHAVIDFLDFYLGHYHWPAFNLADSAITVGVVLLLIDSLIGRRERPRVTSVEVGDRVEDG